MYPKVSGDDGARTQRARELAVTGVVSAVLGTVPVGRMPRTLRGAYVLVPAVLAGGATFFALRSSSPDTGPRRQAIAIGGSLALASVVMAAGAAGLSIDRALEQYLRRRGVPVPRLMMGVGTGVLMTVLTAVDLDSLSRRAAR